MWIKVLVRWCSTVWNIAHVSYFRIRPDVNIDAVHLIQSASFWQILFSVHSQDVLTIIPNSDTCSNEFPNVHYNNFLYFHSSCCVYPSMWYIRQSQLLFSIIDVYFNYWKWKFWLTDIPRTNFLYTMWWSSSQAFHWSGASNFENPFSDVSLWRVHVS